MVPFVKVYLRSLEAARYRACAARWKFACSFCSNKFAMEARMPRGDKSSYTSKQKRQAEHIESGYKKRGVSTGEAERRAWATVNKETGGGKKGGARKKRTSSARKKSSTSSRGRKGTSRRRSSSSSSRTRTSRTRSSRKK